MSDVVRVIAVVTIVAYVIGRQLLGEPLRGKRVVLLPAVLTVIGVVDLHGSLEQFRTADLLCLVLGGIAAAAIGIGQGGLLRLESRDGSLWGQMPPKSVWLWLLLIVVRVTMTVTANGLGAKAAASGATILLMLGVNRLGQAAVVLPRAMSAGIPFAPEKDGTSFLASLTGPGTANATPPRGAGAYSGARAFEVDWAELLHRTADRLGDRRRDR